MSRLPQTTAPLAVSFTSQRRPCTAVPLPPVCCRYRQTPIHWPMGAPVALEQWRRWDPERPLGHQYGYPFCRIVRLLRVPEFFEVALYDAEVMERSVLRAGADYVARYWPEVLAGRPTMEPPARGEMDGFLDVLAARALRPDDDVIGQVLTVGSGAAAVGATREALTARINEGAPQAPPAPARAPSYIMTRSTDMLLALGLAMGAGNPSPTRR